mmetsp:Transcript_10802/g.19559  ORF Transcript_10802/g.19559 Transcript_10802/m.19559 type:complete len:232 (+) Transcript_10802:1925-2620(+)
MIEVSLLCFHSLQFSNEIGARLVRSLSLAINLLVCRFCLGECFLGSSLLTMSTKTTLAQVNVSTRKSTLSTTKVTVESNGVHLALCTPNGGSFDTASQQLFPKHLLHCLVHLGIILDTLPEERLNVRTVGIFFVIDTKAVKRKKCDTTELVFFQSIHESRSSLIRIDNDVKETILCRHFDSRLKLGSFELKIVHEHSKVLFANDNSFFLNDSSKTFNTHGSSSWHDLANIG